MPACTHASSRPGYRLRRQEGQSDDAWEDENYALVSVSAGPTPWRVAPDLASVVYYNTAMYNMYNKHFFLFFSISELGLVVLQ